MFVDVKSGTSFKKKNRVEKCVGIFAMDFTENCGWMPNQTFVTEKNHAVSVQDIIRRYGSA